MDSDRFWEHLDKLVAASEIVIDRPAGSRDPRFSDYVYPLDYGYLKSTRGGDGAGIDVWIGGLAGRAVVGAICTVDLDKRDSEIKILLGCTPSEVTAIHKAHNFGGRAGIIIRPAGVDLTSGADPDEDH
jgi:inorganic pyrophosphatase